ncbi:amino acid permease-associated region [Delftia acidovorans SPH-1]|jgi:L-asparagine transporter-like permease|uniref:Amino acid permease-associated region n=1 Tax=Delftia acidovorans (strain DSM 14801 / SPH-1) TaxID=398578 RepID=A9BVE2_DELAS|nr:MULTISPECIES: amino acid permease [Delftia]MCP4016333.1 amino acid permease [Delftia sp.]OLE93160.1 MAG: amino acid permease [Delftia sp. 13_1_40CM_3_66_6]ABX34806.1 amino acid permease-associated region [Delftia acidovorans SPH-1]MCP4518275.1 amino acid permease [Delftia sp.]MCP4529929.1 amino acid permease [Delftia sp.]
MAAFQDIQQRETGLRQQLSAAQMVMIAIGGAIGTGLFMGSAFAIGFAGPSVLVSYAIGALISLLLMGCLAEMTVAHPTSGSFGAYAEHYISPLAGFMVRYAYWAAVVLAVGMEVTAIGIYMGYWFPDVPRWIWVVVFSGALVAVNASSVKAFGQVEYGFSMVKIIAIVAFILIGAWVVFGSQPQGIGFFNYTADGGFFPKGLWGTWVAVIIAIFSYLSLEAVAVAAGEAEDPKRAITRAFRTTMARLVIFYLATIALMLAIVPWQQAGTDKSPFVKVMEIIGIPGAASIINFVVLVAALSAMNSQLYVTSRMMFSLSRGGYAPSVFGRLNSRGVPVAAIAISCLGIAVAVAVNLWKPEGSLLWMMSVSMFGAMFTWFMIFVTHLFFRARWSREHPGQRLQFRMWGFPLFTLAGAALMLGVIVTTYFTEVFHMTLLTGLPFLGLLALVYALWYRPRAQARKKD